MTDTTIPIRSKEKRPRPWRQLNLSGIRFGRLVAIEKTEWRKNNRVVWRCICDCGNESFVASSNLTFAHTKSCGCLQIDIVTKHDASATPEYKAWYSMLQRCNDPEHKSFNRYGARGITVCERWQELRNFLDDMGTRPSGMTLERINNDEGYSKDNCKWATRSEQQRNTSLNRMLTFNGETMCVVRWGERIGLTGAQIRDRLRIGWTVEDTLTTPRLRIRRK